MIVVEDSSSMRPYRSLLGVSETEHVPGHAVAQSGQTWRTRYGEGKAGREEKTPLFLDVSNDLPWG